MKHRLTCALLALSMVAGALQTPAAHAALVSTEAMLQQAPGNKTPHALLSAALSRAELREQLIRFGVAPEDALERVRALTPAEAEWLARRMESLPAGGDAVGAIIFVFLVLLVTDILGYTDIYPFVTRTVNGDKGNE